MFRLIAFVLVSLFVAAKAFAADPPPAPSRPALTLDRCVETALANNHLIRAAKADVGAKEGLSFRPGLRFSRRSPVRWRAPRASRKASRARRRRRQRRRPFRRPSSFMTSGRRTAPSERRRPTSRPGRGVGEGDPGCRPLRQAGLLRAHHREEVRLGQEAVLTSAQAHLKQAAAFYEVGVRPRYDVTQAEVEVNNALLGLSTARNNVRLTRISLNNAMGIDPNAPAEIEETLADKKEMPPLDESAREALANRPEVRQADAQVEAALQALRAAQGEILADDLCERVVHVERRDDRLREVRRQERSRQFVERPGGIDVPSVRGVCRPRKGPGGRGESRCGACKPGESQAGRSARRQSGARQPGRRPRPRDAHGEQPQEGEGKHGPRQGTLRGGGGRDHRGDGREHFPRQSRDGRASGPGRSSTAIARLERAIGRR